LTFILNLDIIDITKYRRKKMKKNIILSLITLVLLFLNAIPAKADPTYAMLDANGNVTNIIVCGSACAGGTFAGQQVVLQVAADPVTGENRGGFWYGPGTTTYDSNSGTFTMVEPKTVTNSLTEEEDGTEVTSSATINGGATTQFTYNDTIGNNLFTRGGFNYGWTENSSSTISVNKNNVTESLDFNNRQTEIQIQESIQNSGLALLNSKVQVLISLLGSWVK
jgi:hypothetical protein